MRLERTKFGEVWFDLLAELHESSSHVAPRSMNCREMTNVNIVIHDATENLFVNAARSISYRFAIAEWLWIWFGRADVATIARYNRHIAQFSDDGATFNGAYGTPVRSQWPRIINVLQCDPSSRQAVLQIYRPPTGPTKDVPCTLSIQFLIRNRRLHAIVNMRSSDIWLGLPYDAFTFSMLLNILAAQLGHLDIGSLSFNLGSSHLYDVNYAAATNVIKSWDDTRFISSPQLPSEPPAWLEHVLVDHASLGRNDKVWDRYVNVLLADTNGVALAALSAP